MSYGVILLQNEVRGKVIVENCLASKVQIVRGQKKVIEFKLYTANGDPVNLTSKVLGARLKADDGSYVEFLSTGGSPALAIVDAATGYGRLTIPSADSDDLKEGDNQGWQVSYNDVGLDPVIVEMPAILSVSKRIGE